ncbi:excinuclease ABC subunit C [Novosphingobium sp. Rr 2-17]|nr:excinuclease ABC subunit C [Novosphingobium sp. Rr 2-17]
MFQPAVYIMANGRNGTIYVGVTSNLAARARQHRESVLPGFTSRQGCKSLVWYEVHATMKYAITREKQIKGGSRAKKIALIETENPRWIDLYEGLFG